MRQVAFAFLIGVLLFVLLVAYAIRHNRLPAGWETVQMRLDTADVRWCVLGVPYSHEPTPERPRQVLLRLSAMDRPVPPKWHTVATNPFNAFHSGVGAETRFYECALAAAELDPRLGRIVLNAIAAPYLPPGAAQEGPAGDWMWESNFQARWDSQRGWYLRPDWFGRGWGLDGLAEAAYKPIRLEDSAPDAAEYLWPDPSNPTAVDDLGRTVLHRAAFWGREDLVRKMVAQGLDRDARDKDRWTPLHVAAFWGQVAVVQVLLDAGDGVDLDARGGKAMVWSGYSAPRWEEWDAVGAAPLHLASVQGRLDVVRCLLDRGARADEADANGRTPLMWAAAAGRAEEVKELLARGANARLVDSQGMSARDWAKKFGRTRVEGLLR